jgi:NAD(P)-dependent dehydrogenase (short-subunit alcohol dehydrogenase family)
MLDYGLGVWVHGSMYTFVMTKTVPRVDQLLDLSDTVVLVTGSSSGIGAGIASRLHEAGAKVVIHCANNRAGADALASSLGDRVFVVQGDVQRDAERLCFETVAAFGKLDALVNNAGIQPVTPYLELSQTDIFEMLRVNVQGVMELSSFAAKHMLKNGGSIVNISSIEGLQPAFNHSHYATSKAAVLMHTRASALELGKHGIRVNAIAPGLIDREGLEEAWADGVHRWRESCPLERLGTSQDVADAVLFLVSKAARWVTGATLAVDGGMLSNRLW